jgi:DNA transposition AAA+ family ATPase
MKKIFVKTKNVKGFMNLIHSLKNKPDNISKIGLVYGEAGLGKTKTALYLAIQHDAIYIRAANKMTPKWLLEEIVKELGEIPRFYTADIFRQCVNALKFKPQMIIVDEIDYLLADFRTIENLRDLHDETDVPIVLVGMNLARHKLKKHNHLLDRISESYHFEEVDLSDVKQIVTELSEVEITDDAIKLTHSTYKRFRQIVQTIDKLEKIANTNGLEQIDERIFGRAESSVASEPVSWSRMLLRRQPE